MMYLTSRCACRLAVGLGHALSRGRAKSILFDFCEGRPDDTCFATEQIGRCATKLRRR